MISIGMAANMLGVCIKTLRRWDKQEKIRCYRTFGNHRRFSVQEINRIIDNSRLNYSSQRIQQREKCAIYSRVSSYKQKKRGDLDNQISALKGKCNELNLEISEIYKDLGSGLNPNRKGLWRLIRDAKKGLFDIVIINYKDRLTRFGFRYLEEYLNEFNVKIMTINKLEDKALETELVEDLVSIIQSFSGRLYGWYAISQK